MMTSAKDMLDSNPGGVYIITKIYQTEQEDYYQI